MAMKSFYVGYDPLPYLTAMKHILILGAGFGGLASGNTT